jgi:hypothetical protein
VKPWHGGDQRERWVGSGSLVAQKQFREIQGYKQIPKLIRELEALNPNTTEVAKICQQKKGVVKGITREWRLSTEFGRSPEARTAEHCVRRTSRTWREFGITIRGADVRAPFDDQQGCIGGLTSIGSLPSQY